MKLLAPLLCSGLLCFSLAASAQTVISRNNVFDDLEQAEKADMSGLATQGGVQPLTAYKGVLAADEKILLQVLRPVFDGGSTGWVNCAQARTALARGLTTVSTTAGLTALMTTGLRVDTLHCGANGIPSWSAGIPQALLNIQGRLPVEFSRTRARLGRATPDQVIQAARARVLGNPDVVCMAPYLNQSRQNNERFQDAQRKAVARCIQGR